MNDLLLFVYHNYSINHFHDSLPMQKLHKFKLKENEKLPEVFPISISI